MEYIWLATISGYDETSIVGVYSNAPRALRFCIDFLLMQDSTPFDIEKHENDNEEKHIYKILNNEGRFIIIEKIEIDA